jgi:ATP-dependent helicase HrpB
MFPVEEKIDLIKSHLASGRDVVLASPPGSGKTTCVPPALLDEPWLDGGKIVMLEPRRIAARSVASYIAKKIGVKVGDKVGYQVRLEKCLSKSTRLEIITEGLLTQRILSDMELKGINLIIFDEFHERSLQTDLAFALILEIKKVLRPDLRIIVMSATLDIEEINLFLGGEIVVSEGKMFEVEKRYLGDISIVSAVRLALKETQGDILVFLPGEREIRNSQEKLSGIEGNIEILPLYGSLPK